MRNKTEWVGEVVVAPLLFFCGSEIESNVDRRPSSIKLCLSRSRMCEYECLRVFVGGKRMRGADERVIRVLSYRQI